MSIIPGNAQPHAAGLFHRHVGPAVFLSKNVESTGLGNALNGLASALGTRTRLPQGIQWKDGHVVVGPFDVEPLHLDVDRDAFGGRNVHENR